MLYADALMNDFDKRSETIGSTRRRRYDILFDRVIKMVINTINNIERFTILNWCGNEANPFPFACRFENCMSCTKEDGSLECPFGPPP